MLSPVFFAGSRGRLHCARFLPENTADPDGVLLLPPFAEEMNKSRRMLALLGHALAGRGLAAWLPDHYGTGDSDGDFGDADWALWQCDLESLVDAMHEAGCRRIAVAALRTGALQALELVQARPDTVAALMLWQPVPKGAQYLKQFLRLRQAAGMTGDSGPEGISEMRERLAQGETLEIAGYRLAPALAQALDERGLAAAAPPAGLPVGWFEVTGNLSLPTPPAARNVIDGWLAGGVDVCHRRIQGDSFWGTQELVDVPELVEAGCTFITDHLCSNDTD